MTLLPQPAPTAVAIVIVSLAAAMPAASASATPAEAQVQWRATLEESTFTELLALAGAGRLPPWPEVVSSSFAGPLDAGEVARQAGARELAARLLAGLEEFQVELARRPADGYQRSVDDLLALRDLLAARPGYVNLLLADAVNRIVFVELARRIVAEGRMTAELEAAVEHLREFEPDPALLLELVRSELGPRFPADRVDSGSDPRTLYKQLMSAVSPGEEEGGYMAGLAKVGQVEAYGLLEETDLSWFLLRLYAMDYKIQITLPMLAEYVRKSRDFSPEDGYDEVRSTLALTEKRRRAFDSTLQHTPAAVNSDVAILLERVRTGEIERLPIFGLRPAAAETPEEEAPEAARQEVEGSERS